MSFLVLDPRISKAGLIQDADADKDDEFKAQILTACDSLQEYYMKNYVNEATDNPESVPGSTSDTVNPITRSPRKHDFMARYTQRKHIQPLPNKELMDYFIVTPQAWEGGERRHDILDWWRMQSTRFPNLSRMARDILSIPGMSH